MNYLAAIIILLLPFLSGCVHTTVASLSRNSNHPEISLSRKTTGYELGICGIIENGSYPIAWIDLNGRKDKYSDREFIVRFPSDRYLNETQRRKVSGSVYVDWESEKIRIEFTEKGQPSKLNGTYDLKE